MRACVAAVLVLVFGAPAFAAGSRKRKPKPAPAAPSARPIAITVFHTNDIHGWVMARPDEQTRRPIGGVGALGAYLDRERSSGPSLVLDAGDWFQGTPEGDMTKGRALIDAFNALNYDALELGNHDFDFGVDNLKELVKRSKAPVLGANVYELGRKKRPDWITPWILKDVAGIKVGIFGLLTTAMPQLQFPGNFKGLEFRRGIDEAKSAVALLRGAGATVIIAVTHEGLENPKSPVKFEGDQALAREVPGIDLIVGGHSHTFVRHPERDPKNGTLIVQAGITLAVVGRATLFVDPATKKVVDSTGTLVDLWEDSLGEAPEVKEVIAPYEKAADDEYAVVIATAASALKRNFVGESELNDWVTDCEREWGKADLAVQNGAGTRSDLRKGPVSRRDIFDLMPFQNRLVTLTMKGADVAELLDRGVGAMAMLQESGATYRYDRRPAGQPSSAKDIKLGGKPVDPAREYKVVATDFMTESEGFGAFGRATRKDISDVLLRDVLEKCARRQKLIKPPESPRLTPVEDSSGTQERPR